MNWENLFEWLRSSFMVVGAVCVGGIIIFGCIMLFFIAMDWLLPCPQPTFKKVSRSTPSKPVCKISGGDHDEGESGNCCLCGTPMRANAVPHD